VTKRGASIMEGILVLRADFAILCDRSCRR
jgi:hypothetical protein